MAKVISIDATIIPSAELSISVPSGILSATSQLVIASHIWKLIHSPSVTRMALTYCPRLVILVAFLFRLDTNIHRKEYGLPYPFRMGFSLDIFRIETRSSSK